ncbi:hypothetical protein HCY02_10265 [Acinetobacter radioresistens]|nr:hypothetical protein [Acinetobacter radioresistens]
MLMNKIMIRVLTSLILIFSNSANALTVLDDTELSNISGQALFSLIKENDATQGLNFYKLAVDGELSLNTNIKSLQLGCGGANGADGCDIDIQQLSFGCVTNSSGICITQPTSIVGQPKGIDSNNDISNQANLKNFVLTNPFFQFAIKGGDQAATRELVGIRLGAEKANGPMSIGNLKSFSGYLTGKTNLTMLGETDVAVTCKTGSANCPASDASKFQDASAFLGVKNASILNLGLVNVKYRDLTVNYSTAQRLGLGVTASGKRLTQVGISGLKLGSLVDGIVNDLQVNRTCADSIFGGCNFLASDDIANFLLPVLRPGIKDYMKEQVVNGLKTPTNGLTISNLDNYILPYNLSNVHQLDVNSNLFGIALTSLKDGIKYPGYANKVNQGWSMYLEDAFTLDIIDKTSTLMSNMVNTTNAKDGNITMLAPAYRNCYGNLKFC